MQNKVGVIVQVRMDSIRLPGKVLLPIIGIPMLGLLLQRIKRASLIDILVVATSDHKNDDKIECYVKKLDNIVLFRGSKNNVLERLFKAAKINGLSHILRVTGDNPFFDWEIADKLVNKILINKFDYVANNIKPSFPYGIDLEIMTINALSNAYRNAKSNYDKEHVTPFIRSNPKNFRIGNIENSIDLSNIRLTVDTNEDFIFASSIFKNHGPYVTFRDLIS